MASMSLKGQLVELSKNLIASGKTISGCCAQPKYCECLKYYEKSLQTHGHPFCEIEVARAMRTIPHLWEHAEKFGRHPQSSYGQKHEVERWIDAHQDPAAICSSYVANGNFIAAMILLGFEYKMIKGSPNVIFKCKKIETLRQRDRSRSPGRKRSARSSS